MRRPVRRRRHERGSILLETLLALAILTIAGVSLMMAVQKAAFVVFKAREQQTCARMAQTGFARVKNVDFYSLFAADSSSPDYGLWGAYPYMGVLNGLKSSLAAARFDRFTVQVAFMRRDSSDSNADGFTTDLVPFADGNNDLVDDVDPNVRYFDQNANGNYWQTYVSGGRIVAEQPDTHIKRVSFNVYRGGRLVCSQTELISLEQFTAASNPSSESVLSLLVSTPANNASLYRAVTAAQTASRALALANAYPDEVVQLRADAGSPLVVAGQTDPLSDVDVYVGASGVLDSPAADGAGDFAASAPNATTALVEGWNTLTFQATKDTYESPLTTRDALLDFGLPKLSDGHPTGTTPTLAPAVAATLADQGASTTAVSGICPDVVTMRVNGATVPFTFDPATGRVAWVDAATGGPPTLSEGTYTVYVEGGDYAGYKTTGTWTFTADVPDTDNSNPSISDRDPIGMAASDLPAISVRVFDNQSGIVPSSIVLTVDGVVVVDASNVGSAYDPETGTVSFTPSSPFQSGTSHSVSITARHWADDPADKIWDSDTWSFTVP